MKRNVAIIGGAGHVGLPLGLVLADAGNAVTLIDSDESKLAKIENNDIPFREPGASALLETALENKRLSLTSNIEIPRECDDIFLVVGTPIDKHNNPEMENLFDIIDSLMEQMTSGQTLILRSTVYPGTTALVSDKLTSAGFEVGKDIYLAYAPERIAQHRAMEEIVELPQLIGTFDEASYERTKAIFETFVESDCPHLTPTEAEIGKLFTNMWRYITFATANEFYLIADSFTDGHDINIHRILEKTSHEYPRFDVPSPGANVGGPCLTKDGWFLVDDFPGNELVSSAFQINEGMPSQLINRLSDYAPNPSKVTLLGMTFKRNSDDTRNSVSFKMRRKLRLRGISNIVEIEPNSSEFDDWEDMRGSDWVVLMTPHSEFDELSSILTTVANPNALFCDVWGHWNEMSTASENGFFRAKEATTECEGNR